MTRSLRAAATIVAAALLGLLAAGPAIAADGSVPPEVRDYVADGSLVARLADVYGPDAGGDGMEFDDTTTAGTIVRVHEWTQALLAGEDTDHPVELVNEWIVPISIAEEAAGLAIVWINPQTDLPELASFDADPELATALSAVPDGAALVHDASSAAWFALADDGLLTPLVPGTTGLSTPVPLDDVALLAPPSNAPVPTDPNTGLGLAIGVIAVLFVVIVVALLVPGRGGREARAGSGPARPVDEADAAEPEPEVQPGPEVEPEAAAEEPVVARPVRKPRAKKPPAPPTEAEAQAAAQEETAAEAGDAPPTDEASPTPAAPARKPRARKAPAATPADGG